MRKKICDPYFKSHRLLTLKLTLKHLLPVLYIRSSPEKARGRKKLYRKNSAESFASSNFTLFYKELLNTYYNIKYQMLYQRLLKYIKI
jgi:hypothetical protein